jgi:uncharacterized membrane protein YeiH
MDFVHIATLVKALDVLATFVFALVGARVAADRGLDYGGIAFIAAVASTTGGTLRNISLGIRPNWITNPWILSSIALAFVITIILQTTKPIGRFLLMMDTLGLAVAAVSGSQIALAYKASWYAAVVLGVITAVAGGLLRDLLCQVEPVVLHRETLATSALVGSSIYVALTKSSININLAALIGGLSVMAVRTLSIYFDLHLPKINKQK